MSERKNGPLVLGALWFAAAISLAESAAGGLFVDAGFRNGTLISIAGHLAGGLLFLAAGLLSARSGKRAIAVCEEAFGRGGPVLFGFANLIQLVGWTAVMIIVGARSLHAVLPAVSEGVWRAILAGLVLLWTILGPQGVGRLNAVAALLLGLLCAAMSVKIFSHPSLGLFGHSPASASAAQSLPGSAGPAFGPLFDLAIIMPLSWLPLVGDYLAGARKPVKAALISALAYTLGSIWMYALGLGSLIVTGSSNPVAALGAGWALPALGVVLLSTVTTAFLDATSGGISLVTALPRLGERPGRIIAGLAGCLLALASPVEEYEGFLLLIGAVFAPLYAVLFADRAVSRCVGMRLSGLARSLPAFASWALGFIFHQLGSRGTISFPLYFPGISLPVMAAIALFYFTIAALIHRFLKRSTSV